MPFVDSSFPAYLQGWTREERVSQTVVTARSGRRQTNINWSRPLRTWTLNLMGCSEADRAAISNWLRPILASGSSFRFRDWSEFEAGCTLGEDGSTITYGSPVQFGTGNGSQTAFPLVLPCSVGGVSTSIPITKPVATGLRVYIGGVNQTSGWTLNASTGVVTFSSAPSNGAAIAWAGLFDHHCQLAEDMTAMTVEAPSVGEWQQVKLIEVME